jgi:endonuclease/exonuclease/phosphatase family metal-dependent hydrolase
MRRLPPAARTIALTAATLLAVPLPPSTASPAEAPVTTAKLSTPDPIVSVTGVRGPRPGETTITWQTSGRYTDYYKITTALTAFGGRSTPSVGRHSTTFVAYGGSRRSLTLTAAQTASAGAGLRTGRRLFFRIAAVNKGTSGSVVRRFPSLRHTTIAGHRSTMSGTQLRFAEYNVRVKASDVPGHPWWRRQRLVAGRIAGAHPDVAGLQELMPGMWTSQDGGIGLAASLRRAGASGYRLTRRTAYWQRAGQDTRILYDTNRLQLTSSCPQTRPSCYILIPDPQHRRVAAYARFRDRASGKSFYFVSAHLSNGNDSATDALRGRQAQAINAGIRKVNRHGLPVVIATDANSSQTSKGVDAPHSVLLKAGWYNTIAASHTVNVRYDSVNKFRFPEKPSAWGFGSMFDTIMTLGMPGADLFKQVLTGAPGPSDHNLIYSDVRLPRP